MEGQLGLSELSVISWMSAFQGCPLRGVPLYTQKMGRSPETRLPGHDATLRDFRSLCSVVTGSAYEDAVLNLMAMGYERDVVVRALHASFNNPERAADYLINVSTRKGAERREECLYLGKGRRPCVTLPIVLIRWKAIFFPCPDKMEGHIFPLS